MRRSRAIYQPGAAVLAAAVVAAAVPQPGGADSIRSVRAARAALAAREHSTVLDLYALDSRL